MARYIFIRITETQLTSADVDGAEWVIIEKDEPQQIIDKGTLYEPPLLGLGDKVIVCIPALKLMLSKIALPDSNVNRLRKIVPFAMEEQILDNVSDVHFAIGQVEKGADTAVAVIQKTLLGDTLKSFETLGLNPTVMVPDCLCIPLDEKTWTVFVEHNVALVRTGRDTGFSCSIDILVLMLTQYLKEDYVTQPDNIKSYNVPQDLQNEIMAILFESDVDFSTFDVSGNTEMLFLEQYIENTPSINLLQGSYSRRQKIGQQLRPWMPVAGLFAAWVILALIMDIVNYSKLSSTVAALNQQQIKIFKTAFPDAKKIINPKKQMESRLKQLLKKAGKNSSSGTTMLTITASTLKKHKVISIKTLRYTDSKLDVDIKLKNLQVLDELKESLTNNGQWEVEVLSATSRDNFVESRIQIRG